MNSHEQLKAAYNKTFYPSGGQPNPQARAQLSGIIRLGDQEFTIPPVLVGQNTDIRSIVQALLSLPEAQQPKPVPAEEEPEPETIEKPKPNQDLKDIAHITYRNTPYLVQYIVEDGEDLHIVLRDTHDKDHGKVLSPKSPVHRGIVKAYKEQRAKQLAEKPAEES